MLDAGRIPRWKHAYLFTLVLSSGPRVQQKNMLTIIFVLSNVRTNRSYFLSNHHCVDSLIVR